MAGIVTNFYRGEKINEKWLKTCNNEGLTRKVLKGLRPKYEEHHNLYISDEAIVAATKLSSKYVNDRFLPDKAIDVLDSSFDVEYYTNIYLTINNFTT